MTLLEQILQDKRDEIERAKGARPLSELRQQIQSCPKPLGFQRALASDGFGIIAEIKRKSPSMGEMIPGNFAEAPEAYKQSGIVKAVSILTDGKYFGMAIDDLQKLKAQVGKPVLRKDFICDEYQVWEARAFGADAILLMASVLNKQRLRTLFELASELGMDVLFECHSREEIESLPENASIVGINSRKFKTGHGSLRYRAARLIGRLKLFDRFGFKDLSTDLAIFKELIGFLPKPVIKVAESGLKPSGISVVRELGFDCALIGTSLLKSPIGVKATLDSFAAALEPGTGSRSAVASPKPASV